VFACVSVHGHTSETTGPIFTNFFLHITYGRAWLDHPLAALRWPEIGDAEKAHTQSGPAGGNKDLHRGVHSIRGCPITGAAKGGGGTPPEIGFTRKFLAAPLS